MKQVTIKRLRGFYFALAAAAATVFVVAPAYAGQQKVGAIIGDFVQAQPDATPHFTCEVRPFDLSAGLYCYDPFTIRAAYGVQTLINNGANGAGQTIVILDAFGSPTIASDLADFDALFGIPAPPSFAVVTMPGTPAFDPTNKDMVGWTEEIALDVQWSHAMAPGANIVLVAAASDSDADLIAAFNFVVDNKLGNVISMSFGESEIVLANPDGLDTIAAWTAAFKKARQHHITVFASSGDQGVDTQSFDTPSVSWPASSPLVTSVGGTNLRFGTATNASPSPALNSTTPAGSYQFEQVWDDPFDNNNIAADTFGAGGGGMSFLITEPHFQRNNVPDAVNTTLHGNRGVPDVAYNAGVAGGVLVHVGTLAPGATSFFLFGGTSAGSPQWAGIIADINSVLKRPVGFINKWLYQLGGAGVLNGLSHDVTIGNNGFDSVPGYPASAGYDLSTGWGTPNFGNLAFMLSNPPTDSDPGSDP
jgi:subtilase family serine protease